MYIYTVRKKAVVLNGGPDFIKLDMGLIRNVDRDPYKSRVASKLIELARDLGVQTVVEGVESVGEWKWALQHGADYAQGYLFACPQFDPPPSNFHREETACKTED
ncbi:MAG: EAL domain-containing protein, partial [Chloroflexi bacterium]|nr:EAL domain-containing protein [Chloroflexota bacterium]